MRFHCSPALTTVLSICVPLMAGCATIEKDKKAVALQAATHGYQSALRWGYYETAFGYLHPDLRQGMRVPEGLKDLRLTGYDVVQPPTMQDETTATQIVNIDYLFDDRQVVKRVTDRQVWKWDGALDSWWLRSGLPSFE